MSSTDIIISTNTNQFKGLLHLSRILRLNEHCFDKIKKTVKVFTGFYSLFFKNMEPILNKLVINNSYSMKIKLKNFSCFRIQEGVQINPNAWKVFLFCFHRIRVLAEFWNIDFIFLNKQIKDSTINIIAIKFKF